MAKSKSFDQLRGKIDADPARRERVEQHKREAVAEQIEYTLGELRNARALTQGEVARKLSISQPVISRFERCAGEAKLSTLRAYIEAIGGRLELIAVFGEHDHNHDPIRIRVPEGADN